MKHFALTPEGDLKSLKWPPRWYYFDPSIYESSALLQNASWLRETNTELRNWKDIELSSAWISYTKDMCVEGMPIPRDRDLFFAAYLFAKQELRFSRRKLDELNHLWAKSDF